MVGPPSQCAPKSERRPMQCRSRLPRGEVVARRCRRASRCASHASHPGGHRRSKRTSVRWKVLSSYLERASAPSTPRATSATPATSTTDTTRTATTRSAAARINVFVLSHGLWEQIDWNRKYGLGQRQLHEFERRFTIECPCFRSVVRHSSAMASCFVSVSAVLHWRCTSSGFLVRNSSAVALAS